MSSHDSSTFGDVMSALFGSKTGPLNQGPRSDLDSSLRQYSAPKMFTAMLDMTNKGLGVNTGVPLPPDKAEMYKADAKRVQLGEMSSTQAFARSTVDWAKRGDVPGATMNALGTIGAAMFEGMEEHRKMKTGRY